jgi:hypothetical protein
MVAKKTTKKKQKSLLSKALDLIIGKPASDKDRSGNVNANKQLKELDRK